MYFGGFGYGEPQRAIDLVYPKKIHQNSVETWWNAGYLLYNVSFRKRCHLNKILTIEESFLKCK